MTVKDLSECRGEVEILQWIAKKKAELKELETRSRDKVEAVMGNADVGMLDDEIVINWSQHKKRQLDQKALKEAHPELVEEFTKLVAARTFTVVK